jgi:hypothetical protein
LSPRRLVHLAPLAGLLLSLTACGADAASAPPDGTDGGDPEQVREYEAEPVPEGSGSDTADDVNGDGFADLLFVTDHEPADEEAAHLYAQDEFRRLMVVYGSADGLGPATRTVLPPKVVLAVSASGHGGPWRPGTADLDGDGFADIPVHTGTGTDHPETHAVVWGGPTGPDPEAAPTPLRLSEGGDASPSYRAPAAGDFDGDGDADLALAQESSQGTGGSLLHVLYGPFDRDGAPARTARRPLTGWVRDLVPEPLPTDGGPTRLLVRGGDDGEQPPNTLLLTGPGDPSAWDEVELRNGGLAAFADLDGDGSSDLALSDTGSRNNEPGYETEAPEVDHRVNVHPGPLTAPVADPLSADLPPEERPVTGYGDRVMSACDLDGDGTRELAVGLQGLGVDMARVVDGRIETDTSARLVRSGPGSGPIGTENENARSARLFSCADYDADGSDELVLAYGPAPHEASPARWWVTDGAEDEVSFDSAAFTG